MNKKLKKRYILWCDYGGEGWKPHDFDTLREALDSEKYTTRWIITSGQVHYKITEDN